MEENSAGAAAPRLEIAPELANRVLVGQVWAAPVGVAPTGSDLEAAIESRVAELRERLAGRKPAEIAELQPAREFYRVFGIDPTRTRPSSEALLRRVLRGKPLPRISNAVDLCNLLALRFLLPIGLYDRAAVEGAVLLRPGRRGESYVGVRKDEVHLAGRPVLCDNRGPFGNPTADSLRTGVTGSTTGLWMVVFAPRSFPVARMQADLDLAAAGMQRYLTRPSAPAITGTRVLAA